MALSELEREDLLRDGRAMPIRGEIHVDSSVWLVGFRPQGQVSLYAGADLVFQFNVAGELRRVFVAGERLAAENGRLQRLQTRDRGQRLQLVREPLTDQEQQTVHSQLVCCLRQLESLAKQQAMPWRTEGIAEAEFRARVLCWLDDRESGSKIAKSPNAGE